MTCSACSEIVDRSDVPHCVRTCPNCGREMRVYEPGEHGIGFRIEKGDRVAIPTGWLKLSFDPTKSSGMLTEAGLAWFAQKIFLEKFPAEHPQVATELERACGAAEAALRASELVRGLDLDIPQQADAAATMLMGHKDSAAFWALTAMNFYQIAQDAVREGDAARATWATMGAERCRSMLVFKEHLEPVVRMGHSAGRVVEVLRTWQSQCQNASEEFWQRLFSEHTFVLSQVFAAPVVLLGDKAYVGGMRLDRKDAHYVDYLLAAENSGQAILIEIKTPTTRLLGAEYRDGIWRPSSELSGSVVQALNYKAELLQNLTHLFRDGTPTVTPVDPRVILLLGNSSELDTSEKRRSFELFRSALRVLEIVTYDELFSKVDILANLFSLSRTQQGKS
jgi:hypothetical protein